MGRPHFARPSRPISDAHAHDDVVDVLQDDVLLDNALPMGYRWRATLSWSRNPSPHVLSFY